MEYPHAKIKGKKVQNPDVKIKLDVEIINRRAVNNDKNNKQHQLYRSCLTKQESLNLINEVIKHEEEQSINPVEIIDRASLIEHQQSTAENDQDNWERRAE